MAKENAGRRDEWGTPKELFKTLDREFGFVLDVAANRHNRKCARYFGPDHPVAANRDGLAAPWAPHTCWLNPPFSDLAPWLSKAWRESKKGATVVALVPGDTSTRWWAEHAMRAQEIRFLIGSRVEFIPPPDIKASSNTGPTTLLVYRPMLKRTRPITVYWSWWDDVAGLDRQREPDRTPARERLHRSTC